MLVLKNVLPVIGYIFSVVLVNYSFAMLPTWELFGAMVPMATVVVGITFIARDFCQKAVGHWVFVAMGVALVISYFMADPFVAVASAAAFAISELADTAVYTLWKKPFYQRVLLSSVISAPIDSFVFLSLIGFGSWQGILLHAGFKIAVAGVYFVVFKPRKKKQ